MNSEKNYREMHCLSELPVCAVFSAEERGDTHCRYNLKRKEKNALESFQSFPSRFPL